MAKVSQDLLLMWTQAPQPKLQKIIREQCGLSLLRTGAGDSDGSPGESYTRSPGGYLGQFLLGMCRWPLQTPTPL